MKFEALHDRVLIKRGAPQEESQGGLLLPKVSQEKSNVGFVIACGPGIVSQNGHLIPMTVSPGDKIAFTKWSGGEVEIDGEEFLVLKQIDIIGIYYKD